MSFVERRSEETRRYLFYFFIGLGLTVSLITVVIAQLSWRGWEQGVRALLRGEGLFRPAEPAAIRRNSGRSPRTCAPDSTTSSPSIAPAPTTSFLDAGDPARTCSTASCAGQEVIVVSNREPYIHVRQGGQIVVQRPASGLVTAVEPILRACSGTWIAHGSGSADREVVDAHDRVGVPRDDPAYQIRRVWLTPEEEAGYYYGFCKRGALAALPHRPRAPDLPDR